MFASLACFGMVVFLVSLLNWSVIAILAIGATWVFFFFLSLSWLSCSSGSNIFVLKNGSWCYSFPSLNFILLEFALVDRFHIASHISSYLQTNMYNLPVL